MSYRTKRQPISKDECPLPTKRRKGRPSTLQEEEEASSLDTQSGSRSDMRIPSSIYNTRITTDAPAELFRKDLISAMKLPDSEQLSTDAYWIISDQWKQEWERGVQVPVNPDSLPGSSVHEIPVVCKPSSTKSPRSSPSSIYHTQQTEFKLPKHKYIRITKDEHFKTEEHQLSLLPLKAEKSCSYDMDDLDTAWLKLCNSERSLGGLPKIKDDQFENVMEELEMRCWEKVQKIIKEEEGLGIEYDENVICDVCRSPDSEDGNEMVFCDNCNICVHQACYGITTIPSGSWLCRTCTLRFRPECVLCPNKNGAMKCTRSGHKWAHVSCALWIPEVSIGCVEKMEPITKISSIPPSRWALICVLCRERVGACIQCSVKTCKTAYHVTCAFKHGLEMRAIIEDESAEDGVKLRSYCQKHSVTSKKDRNSDSEDEDSTKRKRKDMTSEEKNQARAAKLQEIESEFEKHVNVTDVTQCRDVDNDGILYIYNYWVLKRRSGNNRPLLLPKSDDGDLLGRQQEQADLEKHKMFVQLRQDLERVRNLCYMVSRREKLSRNLLSLREQTFHKQAAVLSDSKLNLSSAEVSAVQEANHGPSIYDRLYSYPDAPDLSTDFETMLSRIAGGVSPEKSNYTSLKWPQSNNPYKRSYINGSIRYSSLSSSSDLELKPPKLISSERSSMDEAELIKSMLNKRKLKEKRLNKKRSKTKLSTDSSTEEENDKVKQKWNVSPNKKLLQIEKQFGSDDSEDVSLPKLSSKRPTKVNNIYSDSDSEVSTKEDGHSYTHTKAAVKEISQGKSKAKVVKDKTTSISKTKETLEKDTKKTKKEDTKNNPTVPTELIVPQRQAAKKATESIHRVHNKHDELNEKKSPEKLFSTHKKSPERVTSNIKSPDKQPTKVNKIKNAEKLSSVEKESDPQDSFSIVPQRQAAKKAIQGIKSGMTKPVEETKVPEPVKKDDSTNKSKRSTKSSLSSTSSSSSSSSSSSTSSTSSSSSSSGSSSSESDTEPEKKNKSIERVSPQKEVNKTKSPPKAKAWLSENKPIKISSSSSSESDKDQKVIRAPDKKLKTSDRRPEHRFQDPPPKREESRRKSIGSDRCDTVQIITCGDSSVRDDGNRKSSDRDYVGTSTSQPVGIKQETKQPIHAIEDKEIEKKLKLDDGDQRVLKEDHGLNKNIQEVKNKNVPPVQHTSDKENKKTDELNLYLPGGHRLNDLKDENLLSSSFLTRQDIERELVNNIDYENKKCTKTPFNCNNHFSGGQRSIFSPQQCNKDIPDFDFDNDMLAVEQAANEEGFGLTRDTDVRNAPLSFTFNNEFLFKDDSKEVTARETLNLVEKLRLGITKKSVPLENENIENIELINDTPKILDPPKPSEPEQKTDNILYNVYNKFNQQSNEVVDVNKVPERDKLDRSESALSDERWVPPSQRSQAESPYQDINDANRWSDSVVMPSRRSDTSNEPSPEHRDPSTTESLYQNIHPFPSSVPMQMDNMQFSQYSDASFIMNPPTSNQMSFMSSSRTFNPQQFSIPPPFSTHQSLMPELNKPLHLQTPCTAAFTSSTQNMAFTAAMISPMTHHDNFIPQFNDISMYNDSNLLMGSGTNNLPLHTETVMHTVFNAINQASMIDNQLSILPTIQSPKAPRVSTSNQMSSGHNLIPTSTNNQTPEINVQSTSNQHQVPVTSNNHTEVTLPQTVSNNQESVISQSKITNTEVTSTNKLTTPTPNQIPSNKQSTPEVHTPLVCQAEVSQNIINQTPVQTPISVSQVSNQTTPSIPTPKQSPALPTTPLPERSPMSIIASSPSVTSSPHSNRTPSDKKSPSKPTRSSSRVTAQSYKSPEIVDHSPEVKKQNKRGPKPQSKTSGRGRGRGRGRSSNHFTDYNPAVSKLAGTAYDLDFVEEFGNDNNGVMENLRAMRERKKSDVKADSKSPVSPKVHSSPNNYRRKHASIKELKPPSPIIETTIEDPPTQIIDELTPMIPGPVDMRTYNSYDNTTSYSDNIYDANTNVDDKVTDIVNTLKEDLQNLSKLSSKDKDMEDQLISMDDQIKIVKLPPPVEKEPVASSTVLQSESRNQLKVKIKGPFLNAKYNNVQNQPILPTIDTSAISMNIPSHSVPPSEAASVPSNFRQMRKKELLRQYCNQQDNIEQTTNHPIVPPLSRNIITIPKAVASMTTIPTKEDYKAVVDANMEKKRTKYGSDDPKSNYFNNIRKEATTPKIKIKIGGEQPMVTTMEEKRSLRPPKKRICDTQNDETNHLIAPTMEQLRRDSMKFRKKVFARFEEDALASTSIPVAPVTKNKKKRRSSPSVSRKKKPRTNKEISQVQVIEAKESTPKLIIRFSKAAPDEAAVSAVTEPKKASPIKLKISRCKEGYVMKPPSNQTNPDTSLNNNCEVR
ncbi:hypothetical protein AGLY_004866 [Aphis glycines]|uniref:PHD finger protein rhinoceros n=1 Tax=Aphis glycines TaxID=307491 RepID=A0A6G0TVH6_APHGL|nr:hypothetical protein AGLY_004866 [Aphis glycines]